jgi:uncharacterized protein YdgA (DUF945 family)
VPLSDHRKALPAIVASAAVVVGTPYLRGAAVEESIPQRFADGSVNEASA